MISVILPSRKRADALKKSIHSLIDTATEKGSFEILVIFDDDDLPSKKEIEDTFPQVRTFVFPRIGYKYLHEYYNRIAAEARGEWLFQWNDDCIMLTRGWDRTILDVDKFCCIGSNNVSPKGDLYQMEILFPIVPKKYFEILGHLSLNRHTDSWIYFIFNDLGLVIPSNIRIMHDRPDLGGGNDDEVYRSREYDVESLQTEETMRYKHADLNRIKEYLNGNTR